MASSSAGFAVGERARLGVARAQQQRQQGSPSATARACGFAEDHQPLPPSSGLAIAVAGGSFSSLACPSSRRTRSAPATKRARDNSAQSVPRDSKVANTDDPPASICPRFVCPFDDCCLLSWSSKWQLLNHVETVHMAHGTVPEPEWMDGFGRWACPTCHLLAPLRNPCRLCRNTAEPSFTAAVVSVDSVVSPSALEELLYQCRPTMKHVPRGAIAEVSRLLVNLLDRATDTRSEQDVLQLLVMPGFVLAPAERGGKKHAHGLARQVRERVMAFEQGMRSEDLHGEPARKKRGPQNPEARRLALIKSAISDGAMSKACKALLQDGNPAEDVSVSDRLRPLFPTSPPPNCPLGPSGAVDFSENVLAKALASFPPGSSSGPSGLRPAHLKDLTHAKESGRLLASLAEFATCFVNGGFPAPVCRLFTASRLLAIPKKDGGLRPIACGDTLRRLAAKALMRQCLGAVKEKLAPLQVGVAVPGAGEKVVHRLLDWAATAPDEVLLQVDISNAFNSLSRSALLEAVASHAPDFLPYAVSCYALPSRMCGRSFHLWAESGVHHGDVGGTLFFSLAITTPCRASASPGLLLEPMVRR